MLNPTVSEEQVQKLPPADKELLTAFASRQRDIDAIGNHLGGLEVLAEWRTFREFDLAATSVGG